MRDKNEVDLLLDSALSTYADPGPDSGLEQRILARVTSASKSVETAPALRRRWLLWGLALPAAACLLLLVFFGTKSPNPPASHQSRQFQGPAVTSARSETPPAPHIPAQIATTSAHRTHLRHSVVAKAAPLPKRDIFPTPQPLTPEERALADFAARAPEKERRAFFDAQKQLDAPLSIAAIRIPPLEPPEMGTN